LARISPDAVAFELVAVAGLRAMELNVVARFRPCRVRSVPIRHFPAAATPANTAQRGRSSRAKGVSEKNRDAFGAFPARPHLAAASIAP
jgi:hypothetical protein